MPDGRWVTVRGHAVWIADDRKTVVATRRRPESPVKAMYRESKARDKQREKERKAATRYGVFPHAIDGKPTGRGYVVRPTDTDGKPHDQRNYGGVARVGKLYARQADADHVADKMYADA